jgi:hypothetical protein
VALQLRKPGLEGKEVAVGQKGCFSMTVFLKYCLFNLYLPRQVYVCFAEGKDGSVYTFKVALEIHFFGLAV